MEQREQLVEALAEAFQHAARASVARGANYEPHEQINTDTAGAWRAVAMGLAQVVDRIVEERFSQQEVPGPAPGGSDVERA